MFITTLASLGAFASGGCLNEKLKFTRIRFNLSQIRFFMCTFMFVVLDWQHVWALQTILG